MSSDKDYKIGYGKPPEHSRFKKGQSGNPKGRPKGRQNLKTDIKETMEQPVRLTENGRSRSVSTQRAVIMRLREKALRGDDKAIDRLLKLAGLLDQEERGDPDTVEPSDRAILDAYFERRSPHLGRSGDVNAADTDGADNDWLK